MKKSSLFAFLLFFAANIFANDAERLFNNALEAYKDQAYNEAIALYETLIKGGYRTAEIEYNLGNVWYKMDSPGRAVLHYERALVLNPKLVQAQKNLKFVQSKQNPEMVPLPDFILFKWWKIARNSLSIRALSILALVVWWAGFAGIAYWFLGKTAQQKKHGLIIGGILLVLSLLPISLTLNKYFILQNSGKAVLIQKTVILRNEPSDSATELMTVYEGLSFEQLLYKNGWWQVRLPNGETGWLPEQSMERI